MTNAVVVDTMVVGWLLSDRPHQMAEVYRKLIDGRTLWVPLQVVAELRFGMLKAGWGELRCARVERKLKELRVHQPDEQMAMIHAALRHECWKDGHALGQKDHDGDRWMAATAMRLEVPLVTHDAIFRGAPKLVIETALQ